MYIVAQVFVVCLSRSLGLVKFSDLLVGMVSSVRIFGFVAFVIGLLGAVCIRA